MNEKDQKDQVIKHLEMIQGIINRLGNNSFLIKSWSMTLIVAAMVLIARHDLQNPYIVLVFILPILGFWILDGYFLRQERLFREVYDEIRQQDHTDFKMDVIKHKNKPKCSRISAMFSITLFIFYSVEVVLIVFIFLILLRGYYEKSIFQL